MVGAMYAEAMMTIEDNMSDPTICQKMSYVEFLAFLCRITHEHYETTEHKNELLYKKLDHMLPKYLNFVRADPAFLFHDKFQAELKQSAKQYIRRKRRYMREELKAQKAGKELDPEIVKEFKEFEK